MIVISTILQLDQHDNIIHSPNEWLYWKTYQEIVIIGYTTYQLAGILPDTETLVISRLHYTALLEEDYSPMLPICSVSHFFSLYQDELYRDREIIVLGGKDTIRSFYPYISQIYLDYSFTKTKKAIPSCRVGTLLSDLLELRRDKINIEVNDPMGVLTSKHLKRLL